MAETIQHTIVNELLQLTKPLTGALHSEESIAIFFLRMGWNFGTDSGMPMAVLANTLGTLAQSADSIKDLLEQEDAVTLDKLAALLSQLKSTFDSIRSLPQAFQEANLTATEAKEIAEDIISLLIVQYLSDNIPSLASFFRWFEVIDLKSSDQVQATAAGKIIRFPYAFEIINTSRLQKLLSNPYTAFRDIYIIPFNRTTIAGAKQFTDKLFPRLAQLASAFGAVAVYGIKPAYGIDFGTVGNDMISGALSLRWKIALGQFFFGTTIMYSPRERANLGWVIVPYGDLTMDASNGSTYFSLTSHLQVGGIVISDAGDVSFDAGGDLTKVDASFNAVRLPKETAAPVQVFGEQDGTHFEIGSLGVGASFSIESGGLNYDVHVDIKKAKLVISGAGQDGFLSAILPSKPIEIPFDFLLGYSTEKSLYLGVSGGLELALPVHISILDILNITQVVLQVKLPGSGLQLAAAISGNVNLGPLTISFEQIGLQSQLDWMSEEKNIGFANLSVGFKPPNGVGLVINAGGVTGGGFLKYDEDKEEYSGALELTIINLISAKAIGIITTKMPDGSKGFSLLIIITAEFLPPYQLGYGFTLNAVGGLIGLNRTVVLDSLREGVRTGAVNHIMFPQNVVANAPAIINDLKTIFPPQQGHFLIGPMAKLGWGTPTLITLSFGLIIEIPGNIAILGVLKVVLPDDQDPLVNITVNFAGVLDFGKKMLLFDSSLYQSRILQMTLEGDMSVRLKWGNDPDFILTVGGFHPQYTPPPLSLPTLKRIAITVLNNSYGKIRLEAYQAVTSNTVQFGAKADLFFGLSSFSVEGHMSFDALFQFSPFVFIIQVSGHVSLKAFGVGVFSISLDFSLQGPTPWRAKGSGSISFFFFSISADFDKTWGETDDTTLPQINVLPQLLEEMAKPEQWIGLVTAANGLLVSLRKLDEADSSLLVHPAGALIVQQKLMPLLLDINKLGNQKIADIKSASLSAARSGTIDLDLAPVNAAFALAQFKDMTDADKLSSPSFEQLIAGVRISLGNGTIGMGKMVRRVVEYEEIIIDTKRKRPLKKGQSAGLFNHYLVGNAASKSVLSKNYQNSLQPFADRINLQEESFAVAFTDNNILYHVNASFSSKAMADDYLKKAIAANRNLQDSIHVIAVNELNSN